jgi:transposase-like protein
VFLSKRRDLKAATKFFASAIRSHGEPAEVTTDRAHALVRVIAGLLPAALRCTTRPNTPTIESNLTTGVSRQDFDRCGASNETEPPAS